MSPGSVLPVRELLGHALMDSNRPDEALVSFKASLKLNPGRFAAVHGAGRAAEKAGQTDIALKYYRELLALAGSSIPRRSRLSPMPERSSASRLGAKQ